MQSRDYTAIVSGVEALVGATLETTEKARLQYLINSRARRAYEAFDHWPRWLVIGEFRNVNGDKVVPYTISGSNDIDTFLHVHQKDPWDLVGSKQWDFNRVAVGARLVNYSFAFNQEFTVSALTDLGIGTMTATASAATKLAVGDVVNIEGVTEVDGLASPNGQKTLLSISGSVITFASTTLVFQSYSALISGATINTPKVYVTYKNAMTQDYGDGTSGANENTEVPLEWSEYIVRGTYADFLRNEGQTEKALVEDAEANKILSEQIERAETQQTHPALTFRVETHGSTQSR